MNLDFAPIDLIKLNDIFIKYKIEACNVLSLIDKRFCTYILGRGNRKNQACFKKSRNVVVDNRCSRHINCKNVNNIKNQVKENSKIKNNKYYIRKEIIYFCESKGIKNAKCKRRVNAPGETCIYHKKDDELILAKNKLENLRNISLFYIMEYLKYSFVQEGTSRRYKNDKINLIINKDNRFFDNTSNIGGGGAIDLLVKLFKYSFRNSISFLNTILKNKKYEKINFMYNKEDNIIQINKNETNAKKYKNIPIYNLQNIDKVKQYLINKRKIDKSIINDLIKDKRLYSDSHNNCIFVDENRQYAFIRSTNSIKYILTNGKPNFFTYTFGFSNNIYLFESIIDALSFRTLFGHDGTYIVTNGNTLINKIDTLEILKTNVNIFTCFDNDIQGRAFDSIVKRIINKQITILKPINKDYNEDLLKRK